MSKSEDSAENNGDDKPSSSDLLNEESTTIVSVGVCPPSLKSKITEVSNISSVLGVLKRSHSKTIVKNAGKRKRVVQSAVQPVDLEIEGDYDCLSESLLEEDYHVSTKKLPSSNSPAIHKASPSPSPLQSENVNIPVNSPERRKQNSNSVAETTAPASLPAALAPPSPQFSHHLLSNKNPTVSTQTPNFQPAAHSSPLFNPNQNKPHRSRRPSLSPSPSPLASPATNPVASPPPLQLSPPLAPWETSCRSSMVPRPHMSPEAERALRTLNLQRISPMLNPKNLPQINGMAAGQAENVLVNPSLLITSAKPSPILSCRPTPPASRLTLLISPSLLPASSLALPPDYFPTATFSMNRGDITGENQNDTDADEIDESQSEEESNISTRCANSSVSNQLISHHSLQRDHNHVNNYNSALQKVTDECFENSNQNHNELLLNYNIQNRLVTTQSSIIQNPIQTPPNITLSHTTTISHKKSQNRMETPNIRPQQITRSSLLSPLLPSLPPDRVTTASPFHHPLTQLHLMSQTQVSAQQQHGQLLSSFPLGPSAHKTLTTSSRINPGSGRNSANESQLLAANLIVGTLGSAFTAPPSHQILPRQ